MAPRIESRRARLWYALCMMLFILMVFAAGIFPEEAGRVLVLGFQSGMISDLEDRILRETIMRELVDRGHEIIPVMELERFFSENPKHIRNITAADLDMLWNKLGARYAISGSVVRNEQRNVVSIFIYGRERGLMHRRSVSLSNRAFHEFCYSLASEIGTIFDEMLMQ